MDYTTLGRTGLLVSKLCFGTMTFGDGRGLFKMIGAQGQAEADALVRTSIEAGINFFDTADVYTEGESERILGQFLKNLDIARTDVVIATKVYGRVGPGRNDVGASRGHILDGVEASLRRLQTDHIDLYQIHANDPVTPVEETLRALDTLVQQGKVRYIGCSNWQAWKLAKALGISEFKNLARFGTLQAYYSIASRDLEREIIPLLEAEQVGLLVWSPLAGGLLSGKFTRNNQKPADSRRTEFDFPIVDKERAWKRSDPAARRGERPASGISRLDASVSGRRPNGPNQGSLRATIGVWNRHSPRPPRGRAGRVRNWPFPDCRLSLRERASFRGTKGDIASRRGYPSRCAYPMP